MQHVPSSRPLRGHACHRRHTQSRAQPVDPPFHGTQALPKSVVPDKTSRVTLRGKHGNISAPIMNIGAWPWGDKATWHWSPEELPAVKEAWRILVDNDINWVDTPKHTATEKANVFAGICLRACLVKISSSKPNGTLYQTRRTSFSTTSAPVKMLKGSLERLRLDYVDIYLVCGPIHPQSIATAAKGLAECVDQGLAKTVGCANNSKEDMIELADELAKYGVPLATNQWEFSILRRYPEIHGLIQACRDRDIVFQSYSPLAQGRLTGKYNARNPPPKTYRFSSYDTKDIEPTLNVLSDIARARGVLMSAVALNYNIIKGAVPTVGIRSPDQAQQNVAALGWRLSDDEIRRIDSVSLEGKATALW